MSTPERNEPLSTAQHIVDVSDVFERTVRCEEQIKSLERNKASTTDLANAKTSILWICFGIVAGVVSVAFYIASLIG